MQYLRARYYNPATGTFNRLDPFSGKLQEPQSLHKYLYVHGDPIGGVDPTGLTRSLTGMLGMISVTSVLTAVNGALGFNYARAADRSPVWGGVSGGFGGLALGIAWSSRIFFKATMREAIWTGFVGGGLAMALDKVNGEFANTPRAYYQSITHESFSWGAVSGLGQAMFKYEFPDDDYLALPFVSFVVGAGQIGGLIAGVLGTGVEYAYKKWSCPAGDPEIESAREEFRLITRDAVPGIFGAVLNFVASAGVAVFDTDLLGVRGLSGPVVSELSEKVVQWLAGGGAAGAVNAAVNEMAEDVVEMVDRLFE